MSTAILNDVTKCIGCESCTLACAETNGLPRESQKKLSSKAFTIIDDRAPLHVKRQCMHCLDPACASVCPVGALHRTPSGAVAYDAEKCIGCRYCLLACPFDVPTYEWTSVKPLVKKCFLCADTRLAKGLPPACTSVCPTGATISGDRDELVVEAKRRLAAEPGRYHPHIYGLEEAGGTSVLYLSPVPFEELGFKTTVRTEPYPHLTWAALSKIPNVASVAGIGLLGIYWAIRRRDEVARYEREHGDHKDH